MIQKTLSTDRNFLETVKSSIHYRQLERVLSYPLAYRIVKYPDVVRFRDGVRIGDIKLKFKNVYVQISGSSGLQRNALFVKIGKIKDFSFDKVVL